VHGLAYLQLHDAGQAVSAFQSAMKLKGGSLTQAPPPFYAQAQIGLARAYAMGVTRQMRKRRTRISLPLGRTRTQICLC
jgi:cytochrome c-type biogenesis protein CcmH/NrfG